MSNDDTGNWEIVPYEEKDEIQVYEEHQLTEPKKGWFAPFKNRGDKVRLKAETELLDAQTGAIRAKSNRDRELSNWYDIHTTLKMDDAAREADMLTEEQRILRIKRQEDAEALRSEIEIQKLTKERDALKRPKLPEPLLKQPKKLSRTEKLDARLKEFNELEQYELDKISEIKEAAKVLGLRDEEVQLRIDRIREQVKIERQQIGRDE